MPNAGTHPNTFAWYSMVSRFKWAKEMMEEERRKKEDGNIKINQKKLQTGKREEIKAE